MQHGPLKTSMKEAMAETEEVIYAVVEGLLQKTDIDPREVRHALGFTCLCVAQCRWQNVLC